MGKTYYYIYRITNLVNGKFYIGKHTAKTIDNDYLGGGKLIGHAIKKYGKENFKKEILVVYDREWQMNLAERILVVVDLDIGYNLCPGGRGGFGYINSKPRSEEQKRKLRLAGRKGTKFAHLGAKKIKEMKIGIYAPDFKHATGWKHSEETKRIMSEKRKAFWQSRRCGAGSHKAGVPGSFPGIATNRGEP